MLNAPPASPAAPPGQASIAIAIRPAGSCATVAPNGDLDLRAGDALYREIDALRSAGFEDGSTA